MIDIDKADSGKPYRFILAPNCSISWGELVTFYLLICMVLLAIGIFFTLQGLWLVLPFSGIEIIALGIALYLTSRKVHRREVITFSGKRVRVEKGVQKVESVWECDLCRTRLLEGHSRQSKRGGRLIIGTHQNCVEVGEFLDQSEKDELAFQLKDCIICVVF